MSTPPAGLGSIALTVAALTLTSRVVGFGRSLVFSKTVGDTCLGDVYNAANTLPNVLFEIVAGGALAGVVVPVVARHLAGGRPQAAAASASALLSWTLLVLTPPALIALLAAEPYAAAFAKPSCPGAASTLMALLVMFVPQIWFYGLAVVTAGVLQAHGRFLAAAAAPLVSSVVVIAVYLSYAALAQPADAADLRRLSDRATAVLGVGTTLGVLALAATTAVAAHRLRLALRPRLRFPAGDRPVVVATVLAGVAGLVLQQLATLEIVFLASRTPDPGALTRFVWANALYLLPYAVLVAPLLQVAFPRLSAAGPRPELGTVLGRFGPPTVVLACWGAALLAATAVPVARVFVLGPGSGRTQALAEPVAAFAPAVIGFALLGLATRTLLALVRPRPAGVATVIAWGTVIAGAAVAGLTVAGDRRVTALAAAVSVGMVVGGICGWWLVARATPDPLPLSRVLARPLRSGLPAAAVASGVVGWPARSLADASGMVAVAGALGAAALATGVFAAVVAVLDRRLLAELWALRAAVGREL